MSGSLALYCAPSAKNDDCLIANDNPDLWFLVILLLLVRNDLIQLVEDDTAASLGLLRTVAIFKKVKQTNKFLETNKYSLKRANEFRFFCRTIPIVFAWKFYRNIFVLKIHVDQFSNLASLLYLSESRVV